MAPMERRRFVASALCLLLVGAAVDSVAGAAEGEALRLADGWVRATPPGARTAAAYLTLVNDGPADVLLEARSPVAATLELHTHRAEGALQHMVRLAEVPVPAGATVRFEPGGLHVMLLDIATPLTPGMEVELTLRFANAGPFTIKVPVVDMRTSAVAPDGSRR
jgi:copper(I)-binding protein